MPIRPAVVIGIGGSGLKTVAATKMQLTRTLGRARVEAAFRFLVIDSDLEKELRELENDSAYGPGFFERDVETVHLGRVNLLGLYRELKSKGRAPSWISPKTIELLPDDRADVGLGADRQRGRLGLLAEAGAIKSKLQALVRFASQAAQAQLAQLGIADLSPAIHVVSSASGGTGSAGVFDLLWLIQDVHSSITTDAAKVRLWLFGPSSFQELREAPPELKDRFHANAVSTLRELLWATGPFPDGMPRTRFVQPDLLALAAPVSALFSRAFLIENRLSDGGENARIGSLKDMYACTGELLSALLQSNAAASFEATFVNEVRAQLPNDVGLSGSFGVIGFRRIGPPLKQLADFGGARFAQLVATRMLEGPPGQGKVDLRSVGYGMVDQTVFADAGIRADLSTNPQAETRYFPVLEARMSALRAELRAVASLDRFSDAEREDKVVIRAEDISIEDLQAVRGEIELKIETFDQREAAQFLNEVCGQPFDFATPAGDRAGRTLVGEAWNHLLAEAKARIRAHGLRSWTGFDDNIIDGIAEFAHEYAASKLRLCRDEIARLRSSVETRSQRLQQHVSAIAEARDAAAGRFGKLVPGRSSRLENALTEYLAELSSWADERLQTVRLETLEEYLAIFGSDEVDGIRTPDSFALKSRLMGSDKLPTSALRTLRNHSYRLKQAWTVAVDRAGRRVETEASRARASDVSKIQAYVPSVREAVVLDEKNADGWLTKLALSKAWEDVSEDSLPESYLAHTARGALTWSDWLAAPPTDSRIEEDLYAAAQTVLASAQSRIEISLEQEMGKLDKAAQENLVVALSASRTPTFARVTAGTASRLPDQMLYLARPGTILADQLTERLVVNAEATLAEGNAPAGLLLVRARPGLDLNSFVFWNESAARYDSYRGIETHLWAGARAELSSSVGVGSLKLLTAQLMFLAYALQLPSTSDRWKQLLFSKNARRSPADYFSNSPVVIRQDGVYLLQSLPDSFESIVRRSRDGSGAIDLEIKFEQCWSKICSLPALWHLRVALQRGGEPLRLSEAFVQFALGDLGGVGALLSEPERKARRTLYVDTLPEVIRLLEERIAVLKVNENSMSPDDKDSLRLRNDVLGVLERELENLRGGASSDIHAASQSVIV